ncbi:hypothetical protein OkiPb00175_52250 [Escherichia coli]
MAIGLGAYGAHETHFRTFSVRESLTHCYISEQTPLGALPGVSVQICSNESGIHELKMSENVSHGHRMRPNRSPFSFMHSHATL